MSPLPWFQEHMYLAIKDSFDLQDMIGKEI